MAAGNILMPHGFSVEVLVVADEPVVFLVAQRMVRVRFS